MPALDLYHNTVKKSLLNDGWIITHDPLHLKWGKKDMYSLSQKDEVLLGIGHRAWGMGHRKSSRTSLF
jgi:XisH protein